MRRLEAVAGELGRLEKLFLRIDEAYGACSGQYGFGCDQCAQTCCGERFYHHTLAETLYLERGLAALPREERERYFASADGVVAVTMGETAEECSIDVLCPLYTGRGCGLYGYRPLICRLHGIPYDFAPPGRGPVRGEGCHRFEEEIVPLGASYVPFDRTLWFSEMAAIEIAIRRRLNHSARIRRTIAEIVVEIRNAAGRQS